VIDINQECDSVLWDWWRTMAVI